MNRHFSKEDKKMANTNLKRYSIISHEGNANQDNNDIFLTY